MLMEADPSVAVTIRKLVMVSLMEVFKDIAPTYRIRPLTSAEKATKVCLMSKCVGRASQQVAMVGKRFKSCSLCFR